MKSAFSVKAIMSTVLAKAVERQRRFRHLIVTYKEADALKDAVVPLRTLWQEIWPYYAACDSSYDLLLANKKEYDALSND